MPTDTGTALLILVVFVLPGFVTLLVKERTHEIARPQSQFERLLSALYYSLLIYVPLALVAALLGWGVNDVEALYVGDKGLAAFAGALALTGLLLPSAIAYWGHRWLRSERRRSTLRALSIPESHRIPTAWDHVFEAGRDSFLRVTLRDGEVVGGYFGPESFAAYGPHGRDLYIEKMWKVDPEGLTLTRAVEGSAGLWLSGADIAMVELYPVDDAPKG